VISICGLAKDSNCASAHVSLSIYLDIISYILLYVHRYIDHVPAPVLAMCFSKDFDPYSKGERHKESEIVQIFESLQPEFPRPPRAF